ncbi:protease modulator HflC [Bacillus solimangrovi]|uniref:Protein HflC n=1 Tax=Bacillus solimangrovi TaxID=1305675 RepID=A0A1E5LCR9_9BACI|nr:protease modulator HflC [Bacillus solimangrovi]OEH91864.1 protease modulator HflC [Bacillus solimangrovi]
MSDKKIINIGDHKSNFDWRKSWKRILFFIILLILSIAALTNVYIVKENEYRVVRQFGQVVRIDDEPGLRFKIPFIQSVTTLPKYQMTYDVAEAEINTKDKKRMIIDNYAIWQIDNPKKMISNVRNVLGAEAKMEEFIYSVVRAELGRLDYDEIINDEKSNRRSLNEQVTEEVNRLLDKNNYGISVKDVRMKRIDLPEENEQSVYRRMISERESKAQEYLSMGDAEKSRIMAQTDRDVKEMLAKAEAEAEMIRAAGEQEAARIYNEAFASDKDFYYVYRTLESYKKTINGETVIILPSNSPYTNLLQGFSQ